MMSDGEHLCGNWKEGLPLVPRSLSCPPESTPWSSAEWWRSWWALPAGGWSASSLWDAPESARQGSKQSPPNLSLTLSWHLSQAPHSGLGEWRLIQGGDGLQGNKVPNPRSLLVPPALFSKNGQPAEGLYNFWWAWQMACWLGHIKPSTDTNLPWRGPPAPSALGCGAQRRMGSDPNHCQLPQLPWPARPRGDAGAHTPVGGFSQGNGSVGPPLPLTPQQTALRTHCTVPGVTDLACSASLLLLLISGPWSSENHFQSTSLGVFSLSATSIQLLLFLLLTGKLRLKDGEWFACDMTMQARPSL